MRRIVRVELDFEVKGGAFEHEVLKHLDAAASDFVMLQLDSSFLKYHMASYLSISVRGVNVLADRVGVRIPVKRLRRPANYARRTMDLDSLAGQIKQNGVLVSVKVKWVGGEEYEVVDGWRRVCCCVALGISDIMAEVQG